MSLSTVILTPAEVRERWPILSVGQTQVCLEAERAGRKVALTVRVTFCGNFIMGISVAPEETADA